tara:strand:+ start:360 stop:584 length:225 start_codon:yes stop_codon:yes gene_type:complete
MKKYLTEKNMMWAAIAILAMSSYNLHNQRSNGDRMNRGMMERMRGMMGEKKAPMGMEGRRPNRGEGRRKEKEEK